MNPSPLSTPTRDLGNSPRQMADGAINSLDKAVDSSRDYAHEALNRADEAMHSLRTTAEPMIDRLSVKAHNMAHNAASKTLEVADDVKRAAEQSIHRYSDAATHYVEEQPVKAMLIAAAVGAGLALLLSASVSRNR
jgi:ElaB/YqjD/DUF883 family membrane-anchored ribosome-binding protein